MAASWDMGLGKDLKKKLREIAWFVAVGLIRWLLERLLRENPGSEEPDAKRE